jgi:hypothetical protein
MAKPLLTLETLAPDIDARPTVQIDNVAYELAMPEEFGLRQEAENARLLRTAARLMKEVDASSSEDLAEATANELEELLSGFLAVILKAPHEVRDRLRFRQKLAIAQAFTRVVSQRTAAAPKPPRSRSTSASSRRGSARRTARTPGSTSRSASSRRSS